MDTIDYFIHTNGFYSKAEYVPLEIGIAEIEGQQYRTLYTVYWDNDTSFCATDFKINNILQHRIHGINIERIGEMRPLSIYLANLKTYFQSLQFERIGCWGGLQRKTVKNYLGVENVKNVSPFMAKQVSEIDAPVPHKDYHDARLERNCALSVAYTYADAIRKDRLGIPLQPGYEEEEPAAKGWEVESNWNA